MQKKLGAVAAAGAAALLILFLVVGTLGQETSQPAPAAATAVPSSPADPIVVEVNDNSIAVSAWTETARVDRVMSGLAEVAAPDAEATLERMINELLLLRSVPQEPPDRREIEAYIAALQDQWGTSGAQVEAALQAAGLQPEALARTVERLLMVKQAQETLLTQGVVWEDWITQQREQATITYHSERIDVVARALEPAATAAATAAPPTTTDSPTPLPITQNRPPLTAAPDFALDRVGGGQFTLSEQLAHGPVVLVFFQRCG